MSIIVTTAVVTAEAKTNAIELLPNVFFMAPLDGEDDGDCDSLDCFGKDGDKLGEPVSSLIPFTLDGTIDGSMEGVTLGITDGAMVGFALGSVLGNTLSVALGLSL